MKIFRGQQSGRGAAVFVATALVVSNLLGFVRNVLIARNVPPQVLDAYYAAFRWPDLLFNVIILGAIATVFQPIFAEVEAKEGEESAHDFLSAILSVVSVFLVLVLLVLFVMMPYLGRLLVPHSSAETQALTVSFSRILLLSPLLFGISNILGAYLTMRKRFVAYSLAPLLYNAAIIFGAALYPRFGTSGLIWSVVVGAGLHLVIQVVSFAGLKFRFGWFLSTERARVNRLLSLGLPRIVGLGIGQGMLIVFTMLGSIIGLKSIAIFSLTNDFQTMPTVVIATALVTIVFPSLSIAYAAKRLDHFRSLVVRAVQLLFYLLIPSAMAMFVLRAQLTRLYLALGKSWSWVDTVRAIDTLGAFSVGIVFAGLVAVLARVLYAQRETKRPMVYAAIGSTVSIIGALLFVLGWHADVQALAWAFSLGQAVNAVLLWLDIRKTVLRGRSEADILFVSLPRILLATWIMASVMWWSLRLGSHWFGTITVLGLLMQTLFAILIGVGVYLVVTVLLGCQELRWLFEDRGKIAVPSPEVVRGEP